MGITVLEKSAASSFTLHKELVDSSKMLLITRKSWCHIPSSMFWETQISETF